MKKTLLFFLACFLHFTALLSQSPGNYQFQFQLQNTLDSWVPGPDGNWFGAGWTVSYPDYPMGTPFVIKWNPKQDSLLWKKEVPMPASENVWDVALLPTTDGGVYIGAAYDGCDYQTPDGLAKLAANGDIEWIIQTPADYSWSNKIWLLPYPSGHLLFQTDRYQIEFDADGKLKWADPVPFPWSGIAPRQGGGYLVYGDHKLGTTNLFLSILEQTIEDDIYHALHMPSGNWLVLGQNKLYRLAPDFSVLAEKAINGPKPGSKIIETDGDFWILEENSSGKSLLKGIDTTTLSVVSTYTFDDNYKIKSVIHLPGDSLLWLGGDCNFDRNQTTFLKSTSKSNPTISASRSLALTDIRLVQMPKVYPLQYSWWDPMVNFQIEFGSVYVTVKNTGTVPVEKFSVNGSFVQHYPICENYKQVLEKRNAILQPGDSLEILLVNNFVLKGQTNAPFFDLCFWTAIPDDQLDANPDDDMYCETFSVIVPTLEPYSAAQSIRVFPNPAVDKITFKAESAALPEGQFTLTLTNHSGQILLKETFANLPFDVPRGMLPQGLYFYDISSPNQRVARGKIVFTE